MVVRRRAQKELEVARQHDRFVAQRLHSVSRCEAWDRTAMPPAFSKTCSEPSNAAIGRAGVQLWTQPAAPGAGLKPGSMSAESATSADAQLTEASLGLVAIPPGESGQRGRVGPGMLAVDEQARNAAGSGVEVFI